MGAKPRVKMKVWVQKWEESERGWGVRPDGYTLHSKREHINPFLVEMRRRETEGRPPGYVPDEYTRPSGEPYEVEVDAKLAFEVEASGIGMWGEGRNPPAPPPGVNPGGWMPMRRGANNPS